MAKKFIEDLFVGSIVKFNGEVKELDRGNITYIYEHEGDICKRLPINYKTLHMVGFEVEELYDSPFDMYNMSTKKGDVEVHINKSTKEIVCYIEGDYSQLKRTDIKYIDQLQLAIKGVNNVKLKLKVCE